MVSRGTSVTVDQCTVINSTAARPADTGNLAWPVTEQIQQPHAKRPGREELPSGASRPRLCGFFNLVPGRDELAPFQTLDAGSTISINDAVRK